MKRTPLGLFGRKLGMTQLFEADGTVVPVTVLEVAPNSILRVKTAEGKDGYNALQVAYGTQKAHRLTRARLGQFKGVPALEESPARHIGEIRFADAPAGYEAGQTIAVGDVFEAGKRVDVTGTSKGKGFAGVMKRHHFAGFERSHGVHEYFRHGGSIGTRLTPGHTFKGKRMGGHMGDERVTIQNLVIAKIDADRNLLFVRGAVPGRNDAMIFVRRAIKDV